MQILVIGSGGREHALCWKLAQSSLVKKVFCAPGNPGTAQESKVENLPIAANDFSALLKFSQQNQIALTVVGPEHPLVEGIVDLFELHGLKIFGPSKAAAQLEGSKIFAKELMSAAKVPTAAFEVFDDFAAAQTYLKRAIYPCVLKADGLAAGKGVVICQRQELAEQALAEMMLNQQFGAAGVKVVIEQFIAGEEISVLGLCSGEKFSLLVPARDHKSLYEGGKGPNTGGMGAFCPVPGITTALLDEIGENVFRPILKRLQQNGTPFHGVLYAGLMLSQERFYVLEFNVRFGDPEAEALLYHLESDLFPELLAIATRQWQPQPLRWKSGYSLCVVLASAGYPGPIESGRPLPQSQALQPELKLFHAGTRLESTGKIVSSGGRVLVLAAQAPTLNAAHQRVYADLNGYLFSGAIYRRDIGLLANRTTKT
jgi:phosphoribosylamine--glycine ligase